MHDEKSPLSPAGQFDSKVDAVRRGRGDFHASLRESMISRRTTLWATLNVGWLNRRQSRNRARSSDVGKRQVSFWPNRRYRLRATIL